MSGLGRWLATFTLVCLLGCDERPEAEKPEQRQPQETVFDDTLQTRDRARAVQGTMDERTENLNKAPKQNESDSGSQQ